MELLLITFFTFVSALIGTITGFGSSTLMVPILLMFLPLPETLLLATILHLFVDGWKIILFKPRKSLRSIILTVGIAGAIFALVGSQLAFHTQTWHLRLLGGLLIASVLSAVLHHTIKLKNTPHNLILGGSLSGLLAGLFGIGGPTRSLLFNSLRLSKTAYLFTSGATALIIDSTRLVGYLTGGANLHHSLLLGLLLFIPATYLGSRSAKYAVNHISPQTFRHLIGIFLFIMGTHFLFWPSAH